MSRMGLLAAVSAWSLVVPVLAAPHATGFTQAETGRVDRLLRLIQARLDGAPAVAVAKWKSMARIEDGASEETALAAVRARAGALGLEPALAVRFAQAQIDAGKIIQAARHRAWAGDAAGAPARDPRADSFKATQPEPEFSAAFLTALRDAAKVLRRPGGRALLDRRAADLIHVGGQDLLAGQAALAPLYDIAN